MTRCQMGDNAFNSNPQQQQFTPSQLYSLGFVNQPLFVRSKSLNDISNDSQISAFASDRFINNIHAQNSNNNSNNYDAYNSTTQHKISTDMTGTTTCLHSDPYAYSQQQQQFLLQHQQNINSYQSNNPYGNSSFENNSRNLTSNLYRGKLTPQVPPTSAANVYNLLNNMNVVTEQIADLHL